MRGYVYILTNRAMAGLVKIGFSTRDSRERATELSGTGVPHSFEVHYEAMVEEPLAAEKALHQRLRANGHHEEKEFFRLAPDDAVHAVRSGLEAIGRAVLFEPQPTYLCDSCRRWSLSRSCHCRTGGNADIKRWFGESDVAKAWHLANLAEMQHCIADHTFLASALFGCGIRTVDRLGPRAGMPLLLAAAALDSAISQAFLGDEFFNARDGIAEDIVQAYFWSSLAATNPAASVQDRVSGRLYQDASGVKLTPEERVECDHRVRVWIEQHRNAQPRID